MLLFMVKVLFLLTVSSGKYYLFAFEDINRDFALQGNERAAWYGSPSPIDALPGTTLTQFDIHLQAPDVVKATIPELFIPEKTNQSVKLENKNLGKIVETNYFKEEIGLLGMWDPVKFQEQGNSGIFFLEPYTKQKTPVIFIHGISGSGHNWLNIIDHLDRDKFQPWIVQYPSGMRLDLISKHLNQSFNELRAIYGFENFSIVAHSMGGLVARGFINHFSKNNDRGVVLDNFVTISTPWLGHAAAEGAKNAPVAVPSWFDMAPGSPYLSSLHQTKLPSQSNYYLLFGYKGDGVRLLNTSNSDGVVTLLSQLSMKSQEEAVKVVGYNEDHTSILNSALVFKQLGEILTN